MKLYKNMTKAEIKKHMSGIVEDLNTSATEFEPLLTKYENLLFPDINRSEMEDDLRRHLKELIEIQGKMMFILGDKVDEPK